VPLEGVADRREFGLGHGPGQVDPGYLDAEQRMQRT